MRVNEEDSSLLLGSVASGTYKLVMDTFDIAWQRSLTGAPGFCLKKKEKINNSMFSIAISVLNPIACIDSVCWSLPILACRKAQSYSLKFC